MVFDWDRTLSVVEGLTIPLDYLTTDDVVNKFVEDISQYILGGKWRMGMLKYMYTNIIASGIIVVILTNNRSANPNSKKRPIFLKIIQTIFPGFNDANLLCASDSPSKSNRFNDYLITSFKGGKKRRTKTRRKTKTRRNTKRRRHR